MLLLTFIAGANRYAIDVARVVELVPKVELRSIPHAPPYLAGLLGYRGKVVPVIDLGLLMGTAPCRDCLSTRIILVNDAPGDHNHGKDDPDDSSENRRRSPSNPMPDSSLLGLIGEQVSDLTYVQREQLVPSPVRLLQVPFLDAIVQTDQGIVQLIAVERVRDASLRGDLLALEAPLNQQPLAEEVPKSEHEDLKAEN
jgi:chemotaxis-related protein WspB